MCRALAHVCLRHCGSMSCLIIEKPRLYCICKTPYDKRRSYLACDGCGSWYHLACVGMKEDQDVDLLEWTCKGCQLKEKQKASKASGVFELPSEEEASEASSGSDSDDSADDGEQGADSENDPSDSEDMRNPGNVGVKGKFSSGRKRKADMLTGLEMPTRSSHVRKQKIRHPVEGGPLPGEVNYGDLAAAPAAPSSIAPIGPSFMPTIEQMVQMMQAHAGGAASGGVPAGAAGAGAGGVPNVNPMDPQTFAMVRRGERGVEQGSA